MSIDRPLRASRLLPRIALSVASVLVLGAQAGWPTASDTARASAEVRQPAPSAGTQAVIVAVLGDNHGND